MIARRDVLLEQIERLARMLITAVAAEREAHTLEKDAEQAATLGLDIAERLPLPAIRGLLTHKGALEAGRATALGIGLVERARRYSHGKPGYARRAAKRGIELIDMASRCDSHLSDEQLEEVLVIAREMV